MKWFNCDCCGAEFRVVSDSGDEINYCPHCGTDIEDTDDDYNDEDEEE